MSVTLPEQRNPQNLRAWYIAVHLQELPCSGGQCFTGQEKEEEARRGEDRKEQGEQEEQEEQEQELTGQSAETPDIYIDEVVGEEARQDWGQETSLNQKIPSSNILPNIK